MRDDIDQRFDAGADEPPFPTKVTVAGIAWIVFSHLIVVSILIFLALAFPEGLSWSCYGVCLSPVLGLFAAGFIFVGVHSVRGTAPGTVGSGIGSLAFGLLNFGQAVVLLLEASSPAGFRRSASEYIQAGIWSILALAMIVVGILALVAAPEYKIWRQFQIAKERWEYDRQYGRQRRRREELEEEDDRPPRRRREELEEEEDLPPRHRRDDDDADRIQRPPR